MTIETIYILSNVCVVIFSIIGNITISHLNNRDKDLEEKYKFKRFISKGVIDLKDDDWIQSQVESSTIGTLHWKTQRYIIKRYKKVLKRGDKENE